MTSISSSRRSDMVTQFNLQTAPCLPLAFVHVHKMVPPRTVVTTSSCSLLLIYQPSWKEIQRDMMHDEPEWRLLKEKPHKVEINNRRKICTATLVDKTVKWTKINQRVWTIVYQCNQVNYRAFIQPTYRAMRISSDMPVSQSFGTCSNRTTVALNDTLIFDKTTAFNIQQTNKRHSITADGANFISFILRP